VDRSKPGSKHHLAVDAAGTPLAAEVTAANVNDGTRLIPLVDAIPPVAGKAGAPLRKPKEVMGDRGYTGEKRRMALSGRGIPAAIARRGDPHGSGLGVLRYVVEQTIALLHQFRRLRTRFDKRADIHQTFLTIGCAMLCWRRLYRLIA
jgi:transposase